MTAIQIINLDGRAAAIAIDGRAIVVQHVPADQLARVQAKALYALQIQAGERPAPYTEHDAEQYAHSAAQAQRRHRRSRRRRRSHARRDGSRPA